MPPTPKSEEILRKQKESRQKKLLLLLLPVLVILLVIQGPRVMKHFDKAKEQTSSVQEKVVQGYEELAPNGGPSTTVPTPGATEPGAAPGAAAIAAGASLPDTDLPPSADEGELISFTRFTARDPFVPLVEDTGTTASSSASSSSSSSSAGSTETASGTGTTGTTSSTGSTGTATDTGAATDTGSSSGGTSESGQSATQVTINVNGVAIVVKVGDVFPSSDPAFTLVAIESGVAKIGLSSGSFSSGIKTLDLKVGDKVTLISQPDGARFVLKLVEIG